MVQTARPPSYDLAHELAEVARRFADHFNGSLIDLQGILTSPKEATAELSALESLEAEGAPDLGETYGPPATESPLAPEEEELPF